jgi:GntR family transcriptional regulator
MRLESPVVFLIDPSGPEPVYRQLMDQVRLALAGGDLVPGDELPSTRSLSSELGVNPMTVSKAYGLLEIEGLVRRRPGLPLVVAPDAAEGRDRRRREALAEVLAPVAEVVRRLDLDAETACKALKESLEASEQEHARTSDADGKE